MLLINSNTSNNIIIIINEENLVPDGMQPKINYY
jgi:hypothetical protein